MEAATVDATVVTRPSRRPGGHTGRVERTEERNETSLIAALRRGDEVAYATIMREHGPKLLSLARRFLRNEECARDAVQETFISAFRSIDRFEGNCKVSTWLHRIAVNSCLMKLRSDRRCRETELDALLPTFLDDGHQAEHNESWTVSVEDELHTAEMRRIVRQCIDELPDAYRTVLLLRDIEEMTTEETAKLLAVTSNTVKVRLHRARQALRALLDPHMR